MTCICWNCKESNEDSDESCGACGELLSGPEAQAVKPVVPDPPVEKAAVKKSRTLFPAPDSKATKPLFPAPTTSSTGHRPPVVPIIKGCECGAGLDKIVQESDGSRTCSICGVEAINPERDDFYIKESARLALRSNLGKRHGDNQDYGMVGALMYQGKPVRWWIVSDGISRAEKSDQASMQACLAADDVIRQSFSNGRKEPKTIVDRAIRAAQKAVLSIPVSPAVKSGESPMQPPGATFVLALVVEGVITVGWVGDSRAYLVSRAGTGLKTELITKDHSYINFLIDVKGMTFAQALTAAGKEAHAIVKSLGTLETGETFEPSVVSVPVGEAVCLLGCSDGLWNYAHPQQDQPADKISELVAASLDDSLKLANHLIDFANEKGGVDNITACIMLF